MIRALLVALLLSGCATEVRVVREPERLTVSGTINTGTTVYVDEERLLIVRDSVQETVGELDDVIGGTIGAALRKAAGMPDP